MAYWRPACQARTNKFALAIIASADGPEVLGTAVAGAVLLALLLTGGALVLREYASMAANVAPAGFEEAGTVAFLRSLSSSCSKLSNCHSPSTRGARALEHRYGLSEPVACELGSASIK